MTQVKVKKTTSKKKASETSSVDDLKNQLMRALADYDNLQKRIEKEKNDFEGLVKARLIIRLLPIFDSLEEVQKHLNDSGLAIVIEEFENTLNNENVIKIDPKPKDMFDEKLHEAVAVTDGKKEGQIVETMLSGWQTIDGQVVRPAKVKVSRKNKEK